VRRASLLVTWCIAVIYGTGAMIIPGEIDAGRATGGQWLALAWVTGLSVYTALEIMNEERS